MLFSSLKDFFHYFLIFSFILLVLFRARQFLDEQNVNDLNEFVLNQLIVHHVKNLRRNL